MEFFVGSFGVFDFHGFVSCTRRINYVTKTRVAAAR